MLKKMLSEVKVTMMFAMTFVFWAALENNSYDLDHWLFDDYLLDASFWSAVVTTMVPTILLYIVLSVVWKLVRRSFINAVAKAIIENDNKSKV